MGKMKCEYCDSIIRDVPDNGVCPNCGGMLATEENQQNKPPEVKMEKKVRSLPAPPVGRYKDAAGYLEIGEDSITFCRQHFIKAHKRTISYDDIYDVAYGPGVILNSGFLCVREWKDRNIPMPTCSADAVFDETAVYFVKSKNEMFRKLYEYLKMVSICG